MTRKIKVLQVIPANRKNGTTVYSNLINEEIKGLEEQGVETSKFLFIERSTLKGFFSARRNLKKAIQEYTPDLIHVHTGSTTTLLVAVTSRNCPWIITFGGSELLGYHRSGLAWKIRERIAISLSRFSSRVCSGIILVSSSLKSALPASVVSKSVVIPRGVDMDLFRPTDKTEARRKLGLDSSETIVLFSQNRENALVKNRKLADETITFLEQKYGIRARLIPIIGFSREDVAFLLNAADALLLTSFHEGSPNIVKESMACNLPVVSVDCGDVKLRLEGVEHSFVCPYDPSVLAASLKKVFESGSRSNGRDMIWAKKVDRKGTTSSVIEYYREIISKYRK